MSESAKTAPEPVQQAGAPARGAKDYALVALVLRFLLLAASVVSVAVMATAKQTELAPLPFPPFGIPWSAQFQDSPALVYFMVAMSVFGLYSIITTLVSFFAFLKPGWGSLVSSHFVIFDVLFLGIVAAATGSAGSVAYVGLKGNTHVRWNKICNRYGHFCRYIGGSIAVSLFAAVVLALLIVLTVRSLSKRIPK